MQGGLARRAGLISDLRKKYTNILLLDGGDSFTAEKNVPELRAEISMEGLSLMKYDGLNLADGELSLGREFFLKVNEKAQFPLLSANIFKNGESRPLGEAYMVKEFGGFKVGVIGLVSPDFFNQEFLTKEGLQIKDPEATLKEILPEVQSKADIIILLSHVGKERTRALIQNIPNIDVAIIGHEPGVMLEPEMSGKTILVQNSLRGEFLGILDLTVGEKGRIQAHESRMEKIIQTTPADPEVVALIARFEEKKAAIDRAMMAEKRRQELHKKYLEGLKMTPEEFLEKMKKEQEPILPGEVLPPAGKEGSK